MKFYEAELNWIELNGLKSMIVEQRATTIDRYSTKNESDNKPSNQLVNKNVYTWLALRPGHLVSNAKMPDKRDVNPFFNANQAIFAHKKRKLFIFSLNDSMMHSIHMVHRSSISPWICFGFFHRLNTAVIPIGPIHNRILFFAVLAFLVAHYSFVSLWNIYFSHSQYVFKSNWLPTIDRIRHKYTVCSVWLDRFVSILMLSLPSPLPLPT